jgi:hypothetical protein
MAFEVKYRVEYSDILGVNWKCDILEDLPSAPAIVNLTATGTPLLFEFDGEDEFNIPLRPSKVRMSVYSITDFQLTNLYSETDQHYKVKIYCANSLYWSGFVVPGEYEEEYSMPPYPVTIKAIDGLNYLKKYKYKYQTLTPDDTYYNGKIVESQIVLDVLAKIGVASFTEYVNIYEESMNSSVSDSPLDQLTIDVDVFRDLNCDEVLSEILKKYNAVIKQVNGQMVIYRPTELLNSTVYGRTFTAWNTKTPTSYSPVQFINRTGSTSTLKQMPGSELLIKRPAKKITINQDYGYKPSWLENYAFERTSFQTISLGVYGCQNWGKANNHTHAPIAILLPSEHQGIVMGHNAYPTLDKYSYQSFGTYAVSSDNVFVLELEYLILNQGPTHNNQHFYIEIKSDNVNRWLKSDSSDNVCTWETSQSYITITENAENGSSGWKSLKRSFVGLPEGGTYTIKLFGSNSAYPYIYIAYKNIKFKATSDEIVAKTYPWYKIGKFKKWLLRTFGSPLPAGDTYKVYRDLDEIVAKKYVLSNAIAGRDVEEDYILGDVADSNIDNVIEQFNGALAVNKTLGYTGSVDKVTTVTIRPDGATGSLSCAGVTRTMEWDTDETTTISGFIGTQGPYYTRLTFNQTAYNTFLISGSYDYDDADISPLMGTAEVTTPFSPGDPVLGLGPSAKWNIIGGSENKPILEIIAGETGLQYSRPKHLIQMDIRDAKTDGLALNPIGSFQDSLNKLNGSNRKFVFNRGELDIKNRLWTADLIEVIE